MNDVDWKISMNRMVENMEQAVDILLTDTDLATQYKTELSLSPMFPYPAIIMILDGKKFVPEKDDPIPLTACTDYEVKGMPLYRIMISEIRLLEEVTGVEIDVSPLTESTPIDEAIAQIEREEEGLDDFLGPQEWTPDSGNDDDWNGPSFP